MNAGHVNVQVFKKKQCAGNQRNVVLPFYFRGTASEEASKNHQILPCMLVGHDCEIEICLADECASVMADLHLLELLANDAPNLYSRWLDLFPENRQISCHCNKLLGCLVPSPLQSTQVLFLF